MSSRSRKRCHCGPQGIGSQLGALAEKGVRGLAKSWFGLGDYTLKSNSLVPGGGSTSSDIQIVPSGNRETRIIYREYLGDVYTHPTVAGAFNIAAYSINPGLLSTFPWFAPIAQQFEQWTPNGVVFEFRSTSSEYVATQALGSVIMCTEYDSLDAAYSNKQEMLNAAYSNEAKPSERIVHGVECDPRDNPNRIFYVRSGAVPTGGSIRDYDLGTFYVATQGGAAANLNLGSLYIHYDITLRKEQLFGGLPARGLLYNAWTNNSLGFTNAAPLQNMALRSGNAGIVLTNTTVTFPTYATGTTWWVAVRWIGTVAAAYTAVATPVGLVSGTTQPEYTAPFPGSSAGTTFSFVYRQTASVATLTFSGMTLPTGTLQAYMQICQINSDIQFLT